MAQVQPISVDASELSDTPQTAASTPPTASGQAVSVDARELSDAADPFAQVGGKRHIDLNNMIGPQLSTAEQMKRDPGMPLRSKIREIESYTQEGRKVHPILATIGDYLKKIYVPGGESSSTPTTEMTKEQWDSMKPEEQDAYLQAHPPMGSPVLPPGAGLGAALEDVAEAGATRTAAAATSAAATTAEQPGIMTQLLKGKGAAQPQAQEAMRTAAGSAASSAAVSTVPPEGLRSLLEDPINAIEAQAKANYKAMDEVTGGKFQPNAEALKNVNEKLRSIAGTNDVEEAKLAASKTRLEWQQEKMFDDAAKAGVPKSVVENARTQFRQAQALRELEAKVFKNPNNIAGNAASGTEDTVNLDSTIRAVQKLADNKEWGSSRLEQALGSPEAAKSFLDHLYAAQRLGVKAVSRQKLAEMAGAGLLGLTTLYEAGKGAFATGKGK